MRARRSSGGATGRSHGRWPLAAALVVAALASACATKADDDPLLGAAADETGEANDAPATTDGDASGDTGTDTGAGAGEATARALAQASERSTDEAHRVEMSMSIHAAGSGPGEQLDAEAPLMTGEQDGDAYEFHMDMGEWMDEMMSSVGPEAGGNPLAGLDMTMDMAGDAHTLYLRAPMFAQLAEQLPSGTDLGSIEDLAALGDQWGRIDIDELGGLSLSEVQGTIGGLGGSDPRAMLDLVAGADDVEELGADQIDGTPVTGMRARLSLGEMLEAQGIDPEEYSNQIGAGLGVGPGTNVDPDELAERFLAIEIPFEAWVDDAGYVRRVSYEIDLLDMLGPGVDDQLGSGGPTEFTMGSTMDFSDYGDDGIAIDVPPDAVDVTEAYGEMLEASAAEAAAAAGNPVGS
jgi:hypothetical protein